MSYQQCPVCNTPMVLANGPINSKWLLVGYAPGREEANKGIPFVGRAGESLRFELGRVGIQFERCRSTNLWVHADNKNEACLEYSTQQLMHELMVHRDGVLFLGSELAGMFNRTPLMEVCGIPLSRIDLLQMDIPCVYIPSPGAIMNVPLGEFRLGISKFKSMIEGE